MGFFSWLTADTGESIPCEGSGRRMRPVFLLQPGGEPPIREDCYEGYGVFGGVQAYAWLARRNLSEKVLAGLSDEEIYLVGVGLQHGHFMKDVSNGSEHLVFHDYRILRPQAIYHPISYAQPVPGYGVSANDLLTLGLWTQLRIAEWIRYPLKFSFDPEAVYESLSPSRECPDQGFFYEDEFEDEDEEQLT